MIRLRKYRIFLFVVSISLLTLWWVSKDASWNEPEGSVSDLVGLRGKEQQVPDSAGFLSEQPVIQEIQGNTKSGDVVPPIEDTWMPNPDDLSSPPPKQPIFPSLDLQDIDEPESSPGGSTQPLAIVPDEVAPPPVPDKMEKVDAENDESVVPTETIPEAVNEPMITPPPADALVGETPPTKSTSTTSKVLSQHTYTWRSLTERFPVPSGSTIQLPTGSPMPIPKIQFDFSQDPPSVRNERQVLLNFIRDAMRRSWNGYRSFAWMKDELRPVTGGSADKFMGWAATLVDSLDTLYIMGLDREFEEAVAATANITFKASTHTTIPMFETTIRYLGGLLGAYDISGGKHQILLEKAVELGEVLMSAFDTENRMPILYYPFAADELPERASSAACLAELGSLSIEFTRLSQLTKEPRYYDAIARITIGLEELQNKTTIPGLWPLQIDTTGCMRTNLIYKQKQKTAPAGITRGNKVPIPTLNDKDISSFGDDSEIKRIVHKNTTDDRTAEQLLRDVTTSSFADDVGKLEDKTLKTDPASLSRDIRNSSLSGNDEETVTPTATTATADALMKRQLVDASGDRSVDSIDFADEYIGRLDIEDETTIEFGTKMKRAKETCVPIGLESGQSWGERYTLGGQADSTYEYLPKEWLLLGGLNDQYRKMYEASQEATIDYLLYRPMIPDLNRQLLFTGSFNPSGNGPDIPGKRNGSMDSAVGHLTCFVGGMFALGAKIFNRTEDLDMAAKLTDGCVWAYESTETGIMPEDLLPYPCNSIVSCPWNETEWNLALDPVGPSRDEWAAKAIADAALDPAVDALAEPMPGAPPVNPDFKFSDFDKRRRQLDDTPADPVPASAPKPEIIPNAEDLANDAEAAEKWLYGVIDEEDDIEIPASGKKSGLSSKSRQIPMTHSEYVKDRVDREHLWPGITSISSKRYLLRPEAIESVFYMFRITGDVEWRRKGYKMFMKIDSATKTKYGNSAIMDVTNKTNPLPLDEMESFWTAETLKYFFLLFSDPDVVSLDDYVFNTEAHPMLRPGAEWKRIRSILKNN